MCVSVKFRAMSGFYFGAENVIAADTEKAIDWLKKAAHRGHPRAQVLGIVGSLRVPIIMLTLISKYKHTSSANAESNFS